MKKLLALTLALAMVLTLAACGGKPQSPDTGDNSGGATAPDSAAAPNDMPGPDEEIPDEITYSFADGVLTVSGRGEIIKDSWFSTVSDAIYETDKNKLREAVTEIVIGEGAYAIGDNAFEKCGNLTKVSMPDSVTYIGEEAFYDCGLTSVTLPSSLSSIGKRAFKSCRSLEQVDIPEGVIAIGLQAFELTKLKEVTVPASVTTWGDGSSPFSQCGSLTDITFLCDGDMNSIKRMIPSYLGGDNQTVTIHAAADSFIAGYLEKQHSEGNLTQYVFEPLG